MVSQRAHDAAFFDMLHELVRTNQLLQDAATAERLKQEQRAEKRIAFPHVQLLAPYNGDSLPSQVNFRPVHCHDISTRGFSYFEASLPTYRKVVILFGRLPFRIFTAEIRHVRKTNKRDIYLVGCQILSRITR